MAPATVTSGKPGCPSLRQGEGKAMTDGSKSGYVIIYTQGEHPNSGYAERISDTLFAVLDELSLKEDDRPSRAEMIRRLIVRATDKGKVRR